MTKSRYRPPLTKLQKRLIVKLLTGHYLYKYKRKNKAWYVLFDATRSSVEKVSERVVFSMDQYLDPKIELWKKDKHGCITLNLSMVRRIDGRHPIKKMYKRRADLENTGRIHKPRKRTKKSNEQESNLLF